MQKYNFFKLLLAIVILTSPIISAPPASATRSVDFSGYSWTVKNGQMGPHANYWNDDPRAVFVDGEGRLHLKITNQGGRWHSSEVYLPASLGYGIYEFELDNRVDQTDTNLVAAVFLYADDARELDIEFTNWRGETRTNAQYVVQPYPPRTNIERFPLALADTSSTHRIEWTSNSVNFSSAQNGAGLKTWEYRGPNNFIPGDERVHINFWMIQRTLPSDGQEKEIIIKRFRFISPPTALPAAPYSLVNTDNASRSSNQPPSTNRGSSSAPAKTTPASANVMRTGQASKINPSQPINPFSLPTPANKSRNNLPAVKNLTPSLGRTPAPSFPVQRRF